jgi:hypothetical protein
LAITIPSQYRSYYMLKTIFDCSVKLPSQRHLDLRNFK